VPRLTKIYTKTGDAGQTRLGGGQRVRKDSRRIDAYGNIDEVNSLVGAARALGLDPAVEEPLAAIQNELFHLGSDLCFREEDKAATALPHIEERHVRALEELMDRMTGELPPLANFVLPGGSSGAAMLHVARAACRRAERSLVALSAEEKVSPLAEVYLNRLSDALFVLARYENHRKNVPEPLWDSRA
jgi:cob(I)alamin adenosyltransferase